MSLFKSASVVSLWTLVSRITGLARELLIASAFGASSLTDAFNVAFRIPNLFRRFFAEGAFSQAFVPVLAHARSSSGDAATQQLIARVAQVLLLALLGLCVIGVLGAPGLVWAMASGLAQHPQAQVEAVWMTRVMFPYIACMSLVALASGVLNTWQRFAVPAATPVLLNFSLIAAAWWGAPWLARWGWPPIEALALGVVLGGLAQLAVQAWALARLGLWPALSLRPAVWAVAWADAGVRRVLRLMGPALLGVGVAHLSMIINTQIASHLHAGSVSWVTYADRLMEFPTALLGVALGVVLTPQLARALASGEAQRYSDLLDWGLRLVVALALPCAVALLVFPTPLVAVLYHYGAMSAQDVQMVAHAVMGWGVGLLGLVAVKVLAPGYYAAQDTRTPVRVAVVVLVLTQVANALLVPQLAHAGLTLSIGLGALLNAAWLLLGLKRSGRYRPTPGWGVFMLQVTAACALLAAALLWVGLHWDWLALRSQPALRVGLLAAVLPLAGALYLLALRASGVDLRALLRR